MQKLAVEYLLATKQRHPDHVALVEGGARVTYAELWLRVLALGRLIRSSIPDDARPVVVSIDKSIDAIVAILAVQLAGHIYVPIDTASPLERRKSVCRVLGDPPILEKRDDGYHLGDASGGTELPDVAGGEAGRLEAELLRGLDGLTSLDPLYVIFTSGTTGVPKGVTISHAGVIDYVDWVVQTYQVSSSEVICSQAPLYFDNSVLDVYTSLATGCALHLVSKDKFVFLSDLVEYLDTHAVSLIYFVPSIFANLAALDLLADRPMTALRNVLFSGEAMPLNTLRYLRKRLPHALLSNLYGPSEITVDAIYHVFGDELAELEAVPIGRPCANTRVVFLDDAQRPVHEPDVVAEICVSGAGVALGYWNDPDKTAAAFIQNPEHARYRDIVYRTGDYGYRASKDGLIYLVGRRDHQIKHLGHRIELGEIEAAVNGLGDVRQSCAVYDSAQKRIVVFYVASSGEPPARLRTRLREALPAYMLPHAFVRLDSLPVTANGKVDRDQLMRRLA